LHAGHLRLSEYVILRLFHNNGYAKTPHCYVIRMLPVLFKLLPKGIPLGQALFSYCKSWNWAISVWSLTALSQCRLSKSFSRIFVINIIFVTPYADVRNKIYSFNTVFVCKHHLYESCFATGLMFCGSISCFASSLFVPQESSGTIRKHFLCALYCMVMKKT